MDHKGKELDPNPSPWAGVKIYEGGRGGWAYSPMILGLSDGKSCHVPVEADPFVLWMCSLDFAGSFERRVKLNLNDIVLVIIETVGDIQPIGNEHVRRLENRLTVELDRGKGV
jgi:hypothetical protein